MAAYPEDASAAPSVKDAKADEGATLVTIRLDGGAI